MCRSQVDDYLAHPPGAAHVVKLKKLYKHFFHRRAKNGHVIYYDQVKGIRVRLMWCMCGACVVHVWFVWFR